MKLCVLGSGSEGNSSLVFTDNSALLVDAGFAAKTIETRLDTIGFDPARLSAILVSHAHSDHIRGAEVLSRRYSLPVYMTAGTAENGPVKLRGNGWTRIIAADEDFTVGDITVLPFGIPHDVSEPVAFLLESRGRRALQITDIGYVTVSIIEKLRQAHLAVVESNHDEELLGIGPYPWHLKDRIAGRGGHISNDECVEMLKDAGGNGLRQIVFAHLSKTNNREELVRIGAESLYADTPVKFEIASQNMPGKILEV